MAPSENEGIHEGFGLICLLIAERRKRQSTKKQSFARLIAGESRDH
jgi:hypothetical protein